MKRKHQKLVLSRETLRALDDHSLNLVVGGSHPPFCTNSCDTHFDCSTDCILPTDRWHACCSRTLEENG